MRCFQQRCLQPPANAFPVYGKRITLFALIAVKEIDKNYNLVFRRPETKCGFAFCKLYCERRCNAFTHCQR